MYLLLGRAAGFVGVFLPFIMAYCAIYSAKRNTYYLGTQLSGIYEVDTHGNILNHFSTANILQNNTVLTH